MAKKILYGLPISPGLILGRLNIVHAAFCERRIIQPEQAAEEERQLLAAAARVHSKLASARERIACDFPELKEIISAQMELVRDPKLLKNARKHIREKLICASWALCESTDEICAIFQKMPDPYLGGRSQDIKSLGSSIIAELKTARGNEPRPQAQAKRLILVARDLSPLELLEIGDPPGIVTAEGGTNSHLAIMARARQIPGIVGIKNLLTFVHQGQEAILDGLQGRLILDPDARDLDDYKRRSELKRQWAAKAHAEAQYAPQSLDGLRLNVCANLDNINQLPSFLNCGAEGVGLYRTEFSFLANPEPEEEDLLAEYAQVCAAAKGGRIIFRTLDLGTDKIGPVLAHAPEANPALGLRGIRYCLKHEQIFRRQIRAILRAGFAADVCLLLPMISSLGELRLVRRLIRDLQDELQGKGLAYAQELPLGVMIETPSAVLIAEQLAREADFFSIGTNDLIHYLLAIDRGNRNVAYLHEPLHPAILNALKQVISAAKAAKIPVSVCGELAADPVGIAILFGLGIDSFSASPHFVPAIKQFLRKLDSRHCRALCNRLFQIDDIAKAKELLAKELAEPLACVAQGLPLSFIFQPALEMETIAGTEGT